MSEVYHTTSIFQHQAAASSLNARISIIGKRLEGMSAAGSITCASIPMTSRMHSGGAHSPLTNLPAEAVGMVFGDGWWLKVAWRAAQQTYVAHRQRGLKTAKGLRAWSTTPTVSKTTALISMGWNWSRSNTSTANTGRCAPRANRQMPHRCGTTG